MVSTIQSGWAGQPGILIVLFPVAWLKLWIWVGFGLAAATPPKLAQVPMHRLAMDRLARSRTALRAVTSVPPSDHRTQAFPLKAVGIPPSTARMNGPADRSLRFFTAISPAAPISVAW